MLATRKAPDSSPRAATNARRELLERVLASSVFAKSERLSTLLTFVCEMTLQGREKELNEQRIGEAVFGRSPDYDSSIDGIVRTQASRLRNRLDLYFNTDGSKEPVQILIPRGGYIPRFVPRDLVRATHPATSDDEMEEAAAVEHPLAEDPAEISSHNGKPHWFSNPALLWTLVAVLAISLALTVWRTQLKTSDASVGPLATSHPNALWRQMFAENQRTLIVSGDSGLVMWQGLAGRNVHLSEYLSRDYLAQHPSAATPNQVLAADFGSRRYTSTVDLDVTLSLLQISQALKGKPEFRYARDVRPNDLKQGNVILVGAAEATPWVELFEPNMNFYFLDDRDKRIFSVFNRSPQGTEPKQWDSAYDDTNHRVYAVVAFLPNLAGQGNALILEGTSMAGTESAWDFVRDESQIQPFLDRIRKPDGSIPHFEVVLGTNNMNGSAGKNRIVAWRITR
jgi:hypothetical protein